MDPLVAYSTLFVQVVIGLAVFLTLTAYLSARWGAPWIPSSLGVVRRMLKMAGVQPGQRVIDLGAGDGRIVILAAREFRAQALGVEIDPLRALAANLFILLAGQRRRAKVVYGDLYRFDLRQAEVVTLYLLKPTNNKLRARLAAELPPGAKIVSYWFSFDGWTPLAIDHRRRIFLYEIGRTGPETETKFV
jgi:hypothetical protein